MTKTCLPCISVMTQQINNCEIIYLLILFPLQLNSLLQYLSESFWHLALTNGLDGMGNTGLFLQFGFVGLANKRKRG